MDKIMVIQYNKTMTKTIWEAFMMKKICYALLALCLASALVLTGCADMAENAGGSVTITVMGRKNDLAKSYMTSIFDQYEKATGNRIKPLPIEDAEFEAQAAGSFANGDVPDIFLHFHNSDLDRFDVKNNFLYLNDEDWVDELTDSSREYCLDEDGNLMGLPFWESSISGCYYNKTILDSLGLRPAATQSEFDVLCQAIKSAGYTPICWAADGSAWPVQFALDPIFADDPDLLKKINKNEITFSDIPEIADMARWIGGAAQNGWFGPNYLTQSIDDIGPVMSTGQAVMTFIWDTWFYTDLPEDGKYKIDDFALMPAFLNTTPNGTYEGGNLNMMMVNKNGKHVDDCLDFLDFCADKENYNKAFDGISTADCFKNQTTNIESPMVTDAAESVAANLRASTAASKILGYGDEDVTLALDALFRNETDAEGCVKLMDGYRTSAAASEGKDGF